MLWIELYKKPIRLTLHEQTAWENPEQWHQTHEFPDIMYTIWDPAQFDNEAGFFFDAAQESEDRYFDCQDSSAMHPG